MTGKNSCLERNLAFKKIWAIRKFGVYENLGYRKIRGGKICAEKFKIFARVIVGCT